MSGDLTGLCLYIYLRYLFSNNTFCSELVYCTQLYLPIFVLFKLAVFGLEIGLKSYLIFSTSLLTFRKGNKYDEISIRKPEKIKNICKPQSKKQMNISNEQFLDGNISLLT